MSYQMIDVSAKKITLRTAIAQGKISVGHAAFELISTRALPKGDALLLAEIAGINGAKLAYQSIPLCHPLSLDHVNLVMTLQPDTHSVVVYCQATADAKTGVEMEALAGVNAALLAIYDLSKMIEPALMISDIRLLLKSGGKKGLWIHPGCDSDPLVKKFVAGLKTTPFAGLKAAIINISDRASQGIYPALPGECLAEKLKEHGAEIVASTVTPDEPVQIQEQLSNILISYAPDIIFTTGGTGLSPRDQTPEAIHPLLERNIPGIAELLRYAGAQHVKTAWLSRSIAGQIGKTIIVTFPGRPSAVLECLETLKDILPHAVHTIRKHHHD